MDPFDLIGQRLENFSSIYDDDGPSSTVQESRPMFNDGGMLVKPNADGSRPGYGGTKVDNNIQLRNNGNAFDVEIQRGPEVFRKSFNIKNYKNKSEALNAAKKYRDQKLG
jgi:hypothetical protein